MAHNLLKIAGLRQLLSVNYYRNRKTGGEKQLIFLHLFYFRDLLDSPVFLLGTYKTAPFLLEFI
ncbi:hypothetical protein ACQKL6_18245, partial [Peribacillus sp. NPDC097197]|uniref:hypothetical protein n=1 Tax=Peribacillus sp. NPDC097197 TaxID=3390615 RepID=UPI003CFD7933